MENSRNKKFAAGCKQSNKENERKKKKTWPVHVSAPEYN